tara:strand:+ start:1311 stop:1712 length:402 start_codon:yes stop_codon:yes gene_type:complete
MNIDIIKIASDTSHNKIINRYTHKSKFKNKICGDQIEIKVNINNKLIKDIGYQTKSCIYCQASASLISKYLVKKSLKKIEYLSKFLLNYFEGEFQNLPKNLTKFNILFNKKNISRKDCILMPLIALKKLGPND